MKTRPWPLVMLALCQALSPLVSIGISAWSQRIPVTTFVHLIFANGSLFLVLKLFGFPLIAAAAIYSVKRWSYPVFLSVMGWILVDNVLVALSNRSAFGVLTLVAIYSLNLATVAYFLIPAVRTAYFNPRLRWWESKPRYRVNISGAACFTSGREPAMIADISSGGLLMQLSGDQQPALGEMTVVKFEFFGLRFELQGRIAHVLERGRFRAFGVKFEGLTRAERKQVRELVTALKLLRFHERQERVTWAEDLKAWFGRVLSTGQGLVPELPVYRPPTAQVVALPTPGDERRAA